MESIISNIYDPSWWFTIFASSLAGIILLKSTKYISSGSRKISRNIIAKRKRKIKNSRWNQSFIFYQIAKANSFFLVFIIISCLYLAWLSSGQLLEVIKHSPTAGVILSIPIYIAELLWLANDSYAKDLIKSRAKITRS